MKTIHKILVPTDFSTLSLTAIEYATSVPTFQDAQIYLIHVVDNVPVLAFHTVDLNSETLLRDSEEKARTELGRLISTFQATKRILIPVVRQGEAYKEIVKFARQEGIDLIIIATHGRTGLVHVLMGSVAEKVVRHSPVPALTVKPEKMLGSLLEQDDVEEQLHMR